MLEKKIKFGEHDLTISTGIIARQADSSVMVKMDDTVVLVTVVINKDVQEGRDFLPLTINYQEKSYAAGKIPGGYFKREGRSSEYETLVARLMDRPIRPLFPKGFSHDIQIIATVLSIDPDIAADIPAMIGASAALSFSGVPFDGPLGAIRIGYADGIYMVNPKNSQLQDSELDLVVAGTKDHVLMVESQADELSESVMLGAVMYGHEMMQEVINLINTMKQELNVQEWEWSKPEKDKELYAKLETQFLEDITQAYKIKAKLERSAKLNILREEAIAQLGDQDDDKLNSKISNYFHDIEYNIVRKNILQGEPRIDGRDTKTVRNISVETGLLPRAHGSGLFTRGETQAIVVTTIGTEKDKQIIDALDGERHDYFMLHYNFPPYSVGEISMQLAPKRREIGHGKLARRALEAVLPSNKDFPYVTRVVSEITESNGSSSMATVCGASISLMDAGVPVKAPVSGVAMGLIKEGEKFAILTDILGDEDHLGDMDFKVAGTANGVTALQMDIKISGITKEIMEQALDQAKDGRMHILNEMSKHISEPRQTMAKHAPRIYQIQIATSKIKDVIGKGGATIRSLTENSPGATIDIDDAGMLKLFCSDDVAANEILDKIKNITADIEVGTIYDGKVVKIVDFGAFVSVLNKKEGLLHISQISEERVNDVADVLSEGQEIKVKVIDIDKSGRFKLSMKNVHGSSEAVAEEA
ncbi:MAG: polyribonucleotide nucleotidyltransferase [Legionellales bacterium]|nr:polyribonucleotide nucleotidyltransferase [Legionellales bacterium]